MSKQKQKMITDTVESWTHLTPQHIGAWVMTGLAIVGTFEAALHQKTEVFNPAASLSSTAVYEQVGRGEGRGEAARMPEEFDIGLQTPHVSGL